MTIFLIKTVGSEAEDIGHQQMHGEGKQFLRLAIKMNNAFLSVLHDGDTALQLNGLHWSAVHYERNSLL